MNAFSAPHAIFVMGPTASGKSEFAYILAKRLHGAVISVDSMQIYRGLDIGTAKESAARRAEVPHYMIDVADYDEEFSVARFYEEALRAGLDAQSKGLLPVFAGGTGLYFESLFYPMSFGGTDKNPALRAELEEEYALYGARHMHDKLAELDAATAERLHENDAKRVIRALEIALTGGKPMSEIKDEREAPDVIAVGFRPSERASLYERINARTEQMFREGLVGEIASLAPDFSRQSMQAIGYREFASYASRIRDGKMDLSAQEEAEICEKIKKDTRNYAKRQLTWFRRYDFVEWFDVGDFTSAEEYVLQRLGKTP